MIYTVTFNPAIDYVVHIDDFEFGKVNRLKKEDMFFGGKGINVSVILKTLGIESEALGFIAGFTGDAIEIGMSEQGIKTDFVKLQSGFSRINVKIKHGEETELNGSGPDITDEATNLLFSKLDKLNDGDVLVLAGSIPASMPENIYETIIKRLSGKGIRVVVDATKDLLMNVIKYKPFLIKPNNHELGELFDKELNTSDEIIDCARKLQQMGAVNVLVSMAGDGSILLDEYGTVHVMGVPKGKVLNSVGAGDSMVAGFMAGYITKKDYDYALKLGTACGSATAFSQGLADRSLIEELMQKL